VLDYWRHREPDNVCFFGMRARGTQERLAPMPNVMGNDQVLVGSIAFAGKILVVDEAFLNRSLGGASATKEGIAEVSGATAHSGTQPVPHHGRARACRRDLSSAPRTGSLQALPAAHAEESEAKVPTL
jgi:hypothetical protein